MLFLHVMLVFIKCRGSWKTSAPHQFFHLRNNTYYRQAWLTKKNRTSCPSPTKVQNVDYPCYTGYSHMEMGGNTTVFPPRAQKVYSYHKNLMVRETRLLMLISVHSAHWPICCTIESQALISMKEIAATQDKLNLKVNDIFHNTPTLD